MNREEEAAFLRQNKIVIPAAHLNPFLLRPLGKELRPPHFDEAMAKSKVFREKWDKSPPNPNDPFKTLGGVRHMRGRSEVMTAVWGTLGAKAWSPIFVLSLVTFGMRQASVSMIHSIHTLIMKRIQEKGLLNSEHTGEYPVGWSTLTHIMRTHPGFYVDGRGNLVLVRDTWMEHARYKYQRTLVGRMGFHTSRWREFLKPPKAHERAKDKAKEAWGRLWGAEPSPSAALVPARARQARVLRRRRV